MPDDISCLRNEYADRTIHLIDSDRYSWFNPANLFGIHQRQRATLALLKSRYTALDNLRILEMGCGDGEVLAEFLAFGASSKNLYGVDLLPDRLTTAHQRLAGSYFTNADGRCMPFLSKSFDLVLQYTALSSILDPALRRDISADMLRVLRPSGLILSYDFWLNPTNPQTRGIRPAEIRRLFPNCTVRFQRITLAPPLARRLVPISWTFASFLEGLRIFNSHYLSVIEPMSK